MPLRASVLLALLVASLRRRLPTRARTRRRRSSSASRSPQNGLWKEATYRWEKATQLDPTYAEAWNNLAIGYEYQGRFDDAETAYQHALKLDPKNVSIRQNYDLFKEINDRTKRRRDR